MVFPDHTHYSCHGRHYIALPNIFANQNRQEGKDQELIQSSTAPFPGYHMGKLHIHKKNIAYRRAKKSAFQAGDYKATLHRQENIANTNTISTKEVPPWNSQ